MDFWWKFLKKCGMALLEWQVRLLNENFDMRVVPMDWRGACIVLLHKGKGDKCECSNSRGVSLLSIVGKICGRVLIKRVRAGTECAIGVEQCGRAGIEMELASRADQKVLRWFGDVERIDE